MDQRAKYAGVYAPTKANVTVDRHQQVDVAGAVLVIRSDGNGGAVAIGGPTEDYIAGLRAMRGDVPLAIADRQGEAIDSTSRPAPTETVPDMSHEDEQDND